MNVDLVDLGDGPSHRGDVAGLLHTCFPDHERDVIVVEVQRIRQGYGFGALVGGQLVGVVTARRPLHGRVFVVYLGVAPEFRRRGIAQLLLTRLVDEAGGMELEMFVDRDNRPAEALYARHGLTPASSDPRDTQVPWSGTWNAEAASQAVTADTIGPTATGHTS